MEDGFKKLKDELTKSLEKSLEKSLTTTNDGIKDLRSWVRWIVGIFGVGYVVSGFSCITLANNPTTLC